MISSFVWFHFLVCLFSEIGEESSHVLSAYDVSGTLHITFLTLTTGLNLEHHDLHLLGEDTEPRRHSVTWLRAHIWQVYGISQTLFLALISLSLTMSGKDSLL